MRALLDVNVLIALFDPGHVLHGHARAWWQENEAHGWASCPITENGFLRIVSQPSYPRPVPLGTALALLKGWARPPRHAFWPNAVSILDDAVIAHRHVLGHRQLTDITLLATAVANDGRLVTFDSGIAITAVKGAAPHQLVTLTR